MKSVLIVDGNYLLSKTTFSLNKNNYLYLYLEASLNKSIDGYMSWHNFDRIFIVSDSREKSWRLRLDKKYKGTRKKDDKINWDFVHETYLTFKDSIKAKRKVRVLEAPTVEGDDWIAFLVHKLNAKNISTVTITNDYDIKQLLKFSFTPNYINIISNEMHTRQLLFMPLNYNIFLDQITQSYNPKDIFNQNNDMEFVNLVSKLIAKSDVIEVKPIELLMMKIIQGDRGDNVPSAHVVHKDGKTRGIGEKGAIAILETYLEDFGDPQVIDDKLINDLADIILSKKKLNVYEFDNIVGNINKNIKLVDLSMETLPTDIKELMQKVYGNNI
jgi:5'-3' exonuclease